MQEEGRDWGAVEGPRPRAGQPHGVVRVHVRQEEEPRGASPAQAPEVHRDGRVRDQDPVHGGGVAVAVGSAWEQPRGVSLRQPPREQSRRGECGAGDPEGKASPGEE